MIEPRAYVTSNATQSNKAEEVNKFLMQELRDLQRVIQELITAVVDLDTRLTALGG